MLGIFNTIRTKRRDEHTQRRESLGGRREIHRTKGRDARIVLALRRDEHKAICYKRSTRFYASRRPSFSMATLPQSLLSSTFPPLFVSVFPYSVVETYGYGNNYSLSLDGGVGFSCWR